MSGVYALAVVDQHGGSGQIEPSELGIEVDGRVQVLGEPLCRQVCVQLGAKIDVGPRMDQVAASSLWPRLASLSIFDGGR